MAETLHLRPSSPPRTSTSHATSLLNRMKRKRDDGGPVPPELEDLHRKKRTETMSHVQIPAFEMQRVEPASHAAQVHKDGFSTFSQYQARGDASQQSCIIRGSSTMSSDSPTKALGEVTDIRKDKHRQTSSQSHSPKSERRLALIRQTIESQFSLEILLKHKELRLIDQELAKCQIAFEQLRRCHVIPYSAMATRFENAQSVIDGSGPAYNNTASQAPAWGVTDGPYTQHYARWLLQDPSFDDSVPRISPSVHSAHSAPERLTRGSKSEKSTFASKSRASRGASSTRLTALPDGYPVPKEEKGPCIVKRSSDGKKVKLICRDCWRSDFSSAQGFINHCRIQHHKTFKSHDAAINECGEEIDEDAEGSTLELNVPHLTPASAGLVHPLVRSAFSHSASLVPKLSSELAEKNETSSTPASSTNKSRASTADGQGTMSSTPRAPVGNLDGSLAPQQLFNASPQTPHLSALLAKIGKGGDLADLVAEAKTRPETDPDQMSDSEEDEDEEETADQSQPMIKSHSTRGVIRQSAPPQVITSAAHRYPLGTDGANDTPKPTVINRHHPAYPSPFSMKPDDASSQADTALLDVNTPLNLSPHTTDPHPAPSLVSDDGDYGNMHSDTESTSDVGDERDPHHEPEVIDHDDIDMGEGSGLNLGHPKAHHQHHHHHHGGPPTEMVTVGRRPRPSSGTNAFEQRIEHDEQRHVSFANPSKVPRRRSTAKDEQ